MILEHQAGMQNLITRLQYESTRQSAAVGDAPAMQGLLDDFVQYLLFANEAKLSTPVQGGSDFATWFQTQGPRDKQGRSLRQLDLQRRLFKYPCSYMIYSEAFDALPRWVRLRVYNRLARILSGSDADSRSAALDVDTRRAVLEILTETKPDVPVAWRLE
jgi:hypothetical protein